jgi:preprotein translocase subunit SecG
MHTVVIVIHLMLVLAMIGTVLLQKSEGGGLVGSTGGFMTSRGSANVLTRATAILAAGFFATSLILSIIASHERTPTSIIQPPASQSSPGAPAPLGQGGGGVLDQLQRGPAQQPAAPPSGPQVPQSK